MDFDESDFFRSKNPTFPSRPFSSSHLVYTELTLQDLARSLAPSLREKELGKKEQIVHFSPTFQGAPTPTCKRRGGA